MFSALSLLLRAILPPHKQFVKRAGTKVLRNKEKKMEKIQARQIFDSRGNPTVEVDIYTDLGIFRAAVPSGASTGIHEALELRDKDKKIYHGKSVFKAVKNINETLAPAILKCNLDVSRQRMIDEFLIDFDGTENKSKYGANAILGISMAACKAGAAHNGLPLYRHIANLACNDSVVLPVPAFNVINGGNHAGNQLAFQEFMIMPTGAKCFEEAMKMGTEVYHHLKSLLKKEFGLGATSVGDEGGFAPTGVQSNQEVLELIQKAIAAAGYKGKINIALDVAASEFFKDGCYDLDFKNPKSKKEDFLSADELTDCYCELLEKFPIVSIEDAFDQDDWKAWSNFMKRTKIQIVGDDLTVTNPKRIKMALEHNACDCLLLKVNQIGTITESIQAYSLAKENGWGIMVSHRSGETEDSFIADLVVGLSTGQIKSGAPCRSERLAKYNQLLRIESELSKENSAIYAGPCFKRPWECKAE